jgi:endonuclease/exonuclease/phosphatase (EEP) superfamily protein YafD
VVIGGDFNNLGEASSSLFAGLRSAGFSNAMTADGIARVAARRPIDWIFTRRIGAKAEVVRAPDASDHDPVIAETFVQPHF